ncbi:MAG: MarR family transcriptional regulator [Maricaulis sp.]|jgi:DNA-binding MarR family transcriptional regulator|nr:MarR family transcriptional regulator [Maricaulis sp.]
MTDTNSPADPTMIYTVMTEIGIIAQLSNTSLERALPAGLRLSHFIVLHHLSRLGGAWTPARLASAIQVTKGAMTNTVQRLEAKGFVSVEADPNDARSKLVTLTDAGQSMRDRALMEAAPVFAHLMDDFEVSEFEAAQPFLARLRASMDKARD